MTRHHLLTLLLLAILTAPLGAVVIELAGGRRLGGTLVRQDEEKVVLRRRLAPGVDKEEVILRADIKELRQSVSSERLAGLRPDRPQAYRDYAEELAEKRDDPEARTTALRLYLTAAHLDPERLGRSCLLGMSNLADTPFEARKYRVLAYLLDPKHDRTIFQLPLPPPAKPDPSRQEFLRCLTAFAGGRLKEALTLARKPDVQDHFEATRGLPAYAQFVELCATHMPCPRCFAGKVACAKCKRSGRVGATVCPDCNGSGQATCATCQGAKRGYPASDDQLCVIFRLFLQEDEDGTAAKPATEKWSVLQQTSRTAPVPTLSLEILTEFNPRESVYRNGKWTIP